MIYVENGKYVVLLYKYDVVEVGDLFVILHIYNKFLSYEKVFLHSLSSTCFKMKKIKQTINMLFL